MKKLLLTAIVVVSISLTSFANNASTTQFNNNGSDIESIEIAGPHTKQYQDMKKLLDEFEQGVKDAKSCEDMDNAEMAMLLKILATAENTYDEDMTPEEEEDLKEQMNRIDVQSKQLRMQYGCETGEEEEKE